MTVVKVEIPRRKLGRDPTSWTSPTSSHLQKHVFISSDFMWCLWRETRLNNFVVATFIFHPVDLCLIDVFYEHVINLLEARTSICFGRLYSTELMRWDEFRSETQENWLGNCQVLSNSGLQPDMMMFKCPTSYAASESKNLQPPTVPDVRQRSNVFMFRALRNKRVQRGLACLHANIC